ncbi:MAG: tetratricopeptide repeat protein [Gammaproteobacteria bacterium]
MPTPPPYINRRRHLLLGVVLLVLLQGCAGTGLNEGKTTSAQPVASAEARAEFERAVAILKSGQPSVALPLFQDMAKRYPTLAGVQVNIGIIHLQGGQTDAATAAFKRAIAINPGNAVAHHHLGIAYRQGGRFDAAREAYLQALKLNPDYAHAHLNLGILYDLYLQQLEQALQHYQQFQRLAASEDKQVDNWVIDLERRIAARQPASAGDS